jgi:hypothetical protein
VYCFGRIRPRNGRTKASDLGVLVRPMQGFIRRANIAIFHELLATTTDEDQRRIVSRLLAEEEAKAPASQGSQDDDDD